MRIALGLEYAGCDYSGWQSQPCGNTVQDKLEFALAAIAGNKTSVVCAGRTDTGVHALEQVVHFDTEVSRPLTAWVRGVNAHLPASIAVRWSCRVAEDFHARFAARARRYCYVLLNRRERPGLMSGRVGWCHHPLDEQAMRAAAECLVGEHDFSSFRSSECQAKTPVKVLRYCRIERMGDRIVFELEASAFLHHMVRNVVGSLVYVGMGRHPAAWLAEVLAARDRRIAAPTFMADGLYFVGVEYEEKWGLPQRSRIIGDLIDLPS